MKKDRNRLIVAPGIFIQYSLESGQMFYLKKDVKGGYAFKHWYYNGKVVHVGFFSTHHEAILTGGEILEGEYVDVDKRDGFL